MPDLPVTPSLTAADAVQGPVGAVPAGPERYALCEEIARGGMGVVYRAADAAFGREVAVKVLQGRFAPGSAAARRFADEARITARLQHPNIPAVFDQGELPDGRPFLAMRLVQGDTLEALLAARPDLGHDRGRFVAVFEQACQAVGYAHSRGVIHRDLKPGNVMVGEFGEVQVMDWGLAKVLASRERQRPEGDPEATTAEPPVGGRREADETQAGTALGTPAFMPPEQAVGALGQVDARSDVFGLGTVLAVILTGKPPFEAGSVETARVRAAQGDLADCFARLEACGADPGLVALCKRRPSPRPADRPADAGEVAEAVAALRAEADERGRRAELDRAEEASRARERRKRRRVWVAVAAAVVAGLTAVLFVQRQAQGELSAANAALEEERRQVQRRFELAQQAIEKFHTGVTQDELLKNGHLKELRARLLGEAAGFYRELEGLLRGRQDDASRRALAGAYRKLAELSGLTGDKAQAEEAYRSALAIRQRLADDHPGSAQHQSDLATSHNDLGLVLRETGRGEEAWKAHQSALAIRQRLARDHPAVLSYRRELAGSVHNLALLLAEAGQGAEAEKLYRRALATWQRLADDHPAVAGHQSDLAVSQDNLGFLLRGEGRPEEAEKAHRSALAIRQKLAGDHPADVQRQSDLAVSHNNLGVLLKETGRAEEAEKEYRAALAIWQKLADGHPAVAAYQIHLAGGYCNLGNSQRDAGRAAESLPLYRQAIGRLAAALSAQPRHPIAGEYLRNSHWGRAGALERLGRYREAAADWRRAVGLEGESLRSASRLGLALCQARGGDPAAAVEHAERLVGDAAASGADWYHAARLYAVASAAQDAGRPLPLREKQADGYARRAVALLGLARQNGFFRGAENASRLHEDDDLAALRPREDFQRLLDLPAK